MSRVENIVTIAMNDLPNGHYVALEQGDGELKGIRVYRTTVRGKEDDRHHWAQRWTTQPKAQETYNRIHRERTATPMEEKEVYTPRERPPGWGRF